MIWGKFFKQLGSSAESQKANTFGAAGYFKNHSNTQNLNKCNNHRMEDAKKKNTGWTWSCTSLCLTTFVGHIGSDSSLQYTRSVHKQRLQSLKHWDCVCCFITFSWAKQASWLRTPVSCLLTETDDIDGWEPNQPTSAGFLYNCFCLLLAARALGAEHSYTAHYCLESVTKQSECIV